MDCIDKLYVMFCDDIGNVNDLKEYDVIYTKYFGKNGILTLQMKSISSMPQEDRCSAGIYLNSLKKQIMEKLLEKKSSLQLFVNSDDDVDVFLPVRNESIGTINILSKAKEDVVQILDGMGFSFVVGPEIEDEYHNFTALNTPEDHPARQMQDSFYFDKYVNNNRLMLRTQTSSVQIRTMQSCSPPYSVFSIGRVYRKDWDMTHTPMFTQVEGIMVDKLVNLSDMKYCISMFLSKFFDNSNLKFRFRASFFPFVEPGVEVDIMFEDKSSKSGFSWMEIMGCGMVHNNVLKVCGVDLSYQGFAFGIGLERLAMLRYGIRDLRSFFSQDIRLIKNIGIFPFVK